MNLLYRPTSHTARSRIAVPAVLLALLLVVSLPLLPALGSRVAALPDTVTVSLVDTDTSILASAELDLSTLSFVLDPYVPGAVTDLSDLTPSALHALIALLEDAGHDATDPAVLSAVDSAYGIYVDSILGSTAPMYWTFRVDGTDSWVCPVTGEWYIPDDSTGGLLLASSPLADAPRPATLTGPGACPRCC
mgnify:CR=1 FL=1